MTVPALRGRPCPLCGASAAQTEIASHPPADTLDMETLRPFWFGIDKERRFFTYHRCGECRLLYNPVFFDGEQLGELYSQMPPNMDLVRSDAIEATQRGYFEALAGRDLSGGYLEIGPDVGYVAREAARRGHFDHFWLVEPNRAVHPQLHTACEDRPATILTSMTNLSAVPPGSIGLAVMIHVLDHLLDPVAMLQDIRRALRPGGTLLIVTHDEQSALRRVLAGRWPAFCLQHPELYNPGTMRRLLERAGYAAVDVQRSRNHFPIDFLARQAAQAIGVRLGSIPLPSRSIALKLGNILTLATAPDQAAAEALPAMRLDSAA